jgi:hypothetical protein
MNIKDYFSIALPSLALSVALYTFLSNNPRFREFGSKFGITVLLQLISVLSCSLILLVDRLLISFMNFNEVLRFLLILKAVFTYSFLLFFIISWLYLGKVFFIIYGSLYHLRKKRFLKYTKSFGAIYEKIFHDRNYENNYLQRESLDLTCFSLSKNQKNLKKGGSLLILYDETFKYLDEIKEFVLQTVSSGETVDYVTTSRSPFELCELISEDEIGDITKEISIIDCFTPRYGFDDKKLKYEKENWEKKGYKFFSADSFAEIHTAANSSWYRFRNLRKKEENNSFRTAHRTIYDNLYSLIRFSSEEQYFLFFRHVFSSEKAYGMITLVLEPLEIKNEIKNELVHMSDIVLIYQNNTASILKE